MTLRSEGERTLIYVCPKCGTLHATARPDYGWTTEFDSA